MNRIQVDFQIIKSIFAISLPSIFGLLITSIYQAIDLYWIGKLGTKQIAALTILNYMNFWIFAFNQIIGSGSVALISRKYGAGDLITASHIIRQSVFLKFVVAIFLGIGCLFTFPLFAAIFTTDQEIIQYASDYGLIFFSGLPFVLTQYTFYTSYRCSGNPNYSLFIMLSAALLAMFLDPLLIFTFDMKMKGAALSNVISAIFSSIISLMLHYTGKLKIKFHRRDSWKPDRKIIKKIFQIGFPNGLDMISYSFANTFVLKYVSLFGTDSIAAYGIFHRINDIIIRINSGFSMGNSALIGQHLGSKQAKRARQIIITSTILVFAINIIITCIEFIYRENIAFFFSGEKNLVLITAGIMGIMLWQQPLSGLRATINSAFFGSGNTWQPTLVSTTNEWIFKIPLMLLLFAFIGQQLHFIWYSFLISNFLSLLIILVLFLSGSWEREV